MNYPAFKVKKADKEEKKEGKWNVFNLVPDEERYNQTLAIEYNHKLICEFVAQGNHETWHKLYYETLASDVWDYLALRKAVTY